MSDLTVAVEDESGFMYRVKLLVLIAILIAMVMGVIGVVGVAFFENLERFYLGNIYVSVSNWDLPLFISLPCLLVMIYALGLRLFDKMTEAKLSLCMKVALFFAVPAIVIRLVYGFYNAYRMENAGYVACWHYSSPSAMSSTVWVRQPGYCIENAGVIRKDVLAWMDTLPLAQQKNISHRTVQKHVNQMLEDWEVKQREKFPHLYD